eukprot:659324-Rhodomonas_salina.1
MLETAPISPSQLLFTMYSWSDGNVDFEYGPWFTQKGGEGKVKQKDPAQEGRDAKGESEGDEQIVKNTEEAETQPSENTG